MRRWLLVGAAIAASSSCALLAVRGPDADAPPDEYPQCKEKSASVLGDIALTFLTGIVVVAAIDEEEHEATAVYAAVTALFGGSAIYGMRAMKRCTAARAKWTEAAPYRGFAVRPDAGPGGPAPGAVAPYRGFELAPDGGVAIDAGAGDGGS